MKLNQWALTAEIVSGLASTENPGSDGIDGRPSAIF